MAINFPTSPQPDGAEYTDTNGTVWIYSASDNAWKEKSFFDANATDIDYTYPGGTQQTVQSKLEQYVTPEDFGAVADYREILGATVDIRGSASNDDGYPYLSGFVTFPEGNGNFTSDDVGKLLTCLFVDNGGNMYPWGTIAVVEDANTIVVTWNGNVNTKTYLVNVAVGTDNEDALQLLMQHCRNNPGTKVQLLGKYGVGRGTDDTVNGPLGQEGAISLPSFTSFHGTGKETSGFYKLIHPGSSFSAGTGILNGIWENRNMYAASSAVSANDLVIDFSTAPASYTAIRTAMGDITKNRLGNNILAIRSNECNEGAPGGRYPLAGSLIKVITWDDDNSKIYFELPLGVDIPNPLVIAPNDWNELGEPSGYNDDVWIESLECHDMTFGRGGEGSSLAICAYKTLLNNVLFSGVARFNTNSVCYGTFNDCSQVTRYGGPEFKVLSNNITINNWTLEVMEGPIPGTNQIGKTDRVLAGTESEPFYPILAPGEGLQNFFVDGFIVNAQGFYFDNICSLQPDCATQIIRNFRIKGNVLNFMNIQCRSKDTIVNPDQTATAADNYYKSAIKGQKIFDGIYLENDVFPPAGQMISINRNNRNDETDGVVPLGHFTINNFYSNLDATSDTDDLVFVQLYGPNSTITSASITNCESRGVLFCGVGNVSVLLDTCDFSDVLLNNIICDGLSRTDFSNTGAGNGLTFELAAKNITRIKEGALRRVQVNAATQRPQDRYLIPSTGSYESIIGPVEFPAFKYLRGLDAIETKGSIYYDRTQSPTVDLKFTVSSGSVSGLPGLTSPIVVTVPQFTLNQYQMANFSSTFVIDYASQGVYGLLTVKIVKPDGTVSYHTGMEAFDNTGIIQQGFYTREITIDVSAQVSDVNVALLDYSCMPELYASG